MKRLAVLLMAFVFSLSATHGQMQKTEKAQTKETGKEKAVTLKKLEGTTVSSLAKTNFYADFGNIPDVQWRRIDTFDEASFTKDGKSMKAFYDAFGKHVGTTTQADISDVPSRGRQEISKQYKDYSIGSVIFFDDNEFNDSDMILYGSQFADEDNYFVELTKGTDKIVVQVNPEGQMFFFKKI